MDWLTRKAPYAALVGAVFIAIGFFTGPNSPSDKATGAQVLAWYKVNHASDVRTDALVSIGLFFLLCFGAVMARYVRQGSDWLVKGARMGLAVGVAGFLTGVGFDFLLGVSYNNLSAGSAQTINVLSQDFFLPILVGMGTYGILGGLAIVHGRIIPKWVGWVMFVLGIGTFAGPIGFFFMLGLLLWTAVVGTWMAIEGPPPLEFEPARFEGLGSVSTDLR